MWGRPRGSSLPPSELLESRCAAQEWEPDPHGEAGRQHPALYAFSALCVPSGPEDPQLHTWRPGGLSFPTVTVLGGSSVNTGRHCAVNGFYSHTQAPLHCSVLVL